MSISIKDKSGVPILPTTFFGTSNSAESRTTYIKIVVLILLCLQNSMHALITRYSQKTLKEKYSLTEVVLLSEVLKAIFSGWMVVRQTTEDSLPLGYPRLLALFSHARKIVVLVILYSINNILAYVALSKVEAAIYTVLNQLKILTTAGFMTVFFDRKLSGVQWRSLILLVLGCVLVASPVYRANPQVNASTAVVPDSSSLSGGWVSNTTWRKLVGITAVLVMVVNSGFASVYMESMLKRESVTVWDRNFQMALLSSLLVFGILVSERNSADEPLFDPLFHGFTFNAYLLATTQAFGGMLVAAALKYADSILKTLASCLAIVVTVVIEIAFLGAEADVFVTIGCIATILATADYTFDPTPPALAT